MTSRTQIKKPAPQKTEQVDAVAPAKTDAERLKDETDAFLDEIDAVLADVIGESSAQEFVSSFLQKGGQ